MERLRTARIAPPLCTPVGAYALVLGLDGEQHRIEKEREGEKLKLLGLEDIQKREKLGFTDWRGEQTE